MTTAAQGPSNADGDQQSQPTPVADAQRVADAALEIVLDKGLAALSIRSVARSVGLSPMSVYRFVDSKDHLLDGVVLSVLDRMELPHSPGGTWQSRIIATMGAWRALLLAHAPVVTLLSSRPVPLGSLGMARLEENILANLADAEIRDEAAVRAFWHLFMLTLGHVVFEIPRLDLRDDDLVDYGTWTAEVARKRGFKHLAPLASELARVSQRGTFDEALTAYLIGLYELNRRD